MSPRSSAQAKPAVPPDHPTDSCRLSRGLFHGSFVVLGAVMLVSSFYPLPVLVQMILYTLPILYIGSHLSLKQREVDAITGEVNKGESLNRRDALLFPVFGSIALLSLYLAYKFLDSRWVNLLLTLYLSGVGLLALAETLYSITSTACPKSWCDDSRFVIHLRGPLRVLRHLGATAVPAAETAAKDNNSATSSSADASAADSASAQPTEHVWKLSPVLIMCYLAAAAVCGLWLVTKHWVLHNVLAVAFCVQAIAIVSVGSFTIATILLCGLFVYDIFWVFGTDVMVTVAKSFEGPAKLIFPVQLDPWQHSILGLGDVVIPGVLIAMCLRFDNFLEHSDQKRTNVDIHQRFPKFYFWVVLVFYELGLLTTGVVMLAVQHAQPALLYLVPYCLLSLFGAAALNGRVKEVLAYKEDEGAADTSEKKDS